jgi:short-subunit dehydrogenase
LKATKKYYRINNIELFDFCNKIVYMLLSNFYKKALITGGKSGIGLGFSKILLKNGLEVWTTSRKVNTKKDKKANIIQLDLENNQSIKSFIEEVERRVPKLDLFINNAGNGSFIPIKKLNYSNKTISNQIKILLQSPIELSTYFYNFFRRKRSGCLVNVSSLSSIFPIPYMSLYNSSKSGLSQFTKSLILENTLNNIKIIDLNLGDHKTNFNKSMYNRNRNFIKENKNVLRVWKMIEKRIRKCPNSDHASKKLIRILKNRKSGTFFVGSFFQSFVAPIFSKFIPNPLMIYLIRKYYKF